LIVVFDAQCLLCSRWVQFLLRHDRCGLLRFASMQGATGRQLLLDAGLQPDALETLLLVAPGRVWRYTGALLRILHALGWPWRLAWAVWIVPAPWRDAAYRWMARHRYRLFGRSEQCLLPPAGTAARFLD
jgi:predicted DCC family thiol-disulfide oxidoreductase YuxK